MSAEKIIHALLRADAEVAEGVGTRIYPGFVPLGVAIPAIAYTHISTVEEEHIDAQVPAALVHSRIQVTVFAAAYPAQKKLLAAVRRACNYERGLIADTRVVCVRRLSVGPDLSNADAGIYMQSLDFLVTFYEPN